MRVLIVSHTFPPDSAVGGLRVARLCRYLPECDIHPFVLTVADGVYESVDPSLGLPSHRKVLRTGSLSPPLGWYPRLGNRRPTMSGKHKAEARIRPWPGNTCSPCSHSPTATGAGTFPPSKLLAS